MSKVQMLRASVKQRLTAAAEEIFVLFERTIAEYEEELSRSKEENERQRKLLDAVFKPQLQLHRADVQQLLESKEEVPPEQQEWSSGLDQEDPEPPHIKEEQKELWTSQEGEQLQGLEEADITTFTLTLVPVMSEDDEKPQSSQLDQRQTEQMKTEADGEDCGGSEPDRNSHPDRHLQPDDNDKMSDSFETDVSDNALKNKEVPVSDKKYNTSVHSITCSECGKTFCSKSNLNKHKKIHTGEKPFSCSVCSKRFLQRGQLTTHMTIHTGEKPFSCSVCKECFRLRRDVVKHMKIHTEEKPVSGSVSGKKGNTYGNIDRESEPARNMTSSVPEAKVSDDSWKETREPQADLKTLKHNEVPVSDTECNTGKNPLNCYKCGKRFRRKDGLKRHMRVHTGEKPFSCTVCQKQFASKEAASTHVRLHSGERPFGCTVCGKRFNQKVCLQLHTRTHTGEKPFSCTLCDKRFIQKRGLADHMAVHMKEKRFMCTACDERFTWLYQLKNHQAICDPVKFQQNQTVKKFSCSECGRRFRRRYSVKMHMRIHTQEKKSTGKNPECIQFMGT